MSEHDELFDETDVGEETFILDPAELSLQGWLEPPQGYYDDPLLDDVAKDTFYVCGALAMLFSGVAMVYHDTHHGSVTVGTLLATGGSLLTIAGGLDLYTHRGVASIVNLFGTLLFIVGAMYYYPEMRDKFIGDVFFATGGVLIAMACFKRMSKLPLYKWAFDFFVFLGSIAYFVAAFSAAHIVGYLFALAGALFTIGGLVPLVQGMCRQAEDEESDIEQLK